MKVLILGGGGFLGQALARQLVIDKTINRHGTHAALSAIQLLDQIWPEQPVADPLLEYVTGDIGDEAVVSKILAKKPAIIFHLAAVVSGEAERNFELGMQVNLHASLRILELIRDQNYKPVFVFASTCAAFGPADPNAADQSITDTTAPEPQSSYGTQKTMIELLVNDYTRKGFLDGRVLRLPTIAVRPGKPNSATSSFISSIIREPLHGRRAACPVPESTRVWISSPRKVIQNFIHSVSLTEQQLDRKRTINLPGITVKISDMLSAMDQISGRPLSSLVDRTPDPFIQSIVLTWPSNFRTDRANGLGFACDANIHSVIKAFTEDEMKNQL